MIRTRLARPGELSEQCRLCAAVLEISVNNPKRVCAACGEINLPSDGSLVEVVPQPVRRPGRPWGVEPLQLLIGASPPVLAVVVGMISGSFDGSVQRGSLDWMGVTMGLVLPLIGLSFLGSMGLILWQPQARLAVSGLFWIAGLLTSTVACYGLSFAVSLIGWLF